MLSFVGMRFLALVFLTACSTASLPNEKDAAPDTSIDSKSHDAGCATIDASCGYDCLPQNGPFWACGSPVYTVLDGGECACRAVRDSTWPDCAKPGPVGEGEFCGTYWWCDRACNVGLTCAPIQTDGGFGDYRTTCQKPASDAGAD